MKMLWWPLSRMLGKKEHGRATTLCTCAKPQRLNAIRLCLPSITPGHNFLIMQLNEDLFLPLDISSRYSSVYQLKKQYTYCPFPPYWSTPNLQNPIVSNNEHQCTLFIWKLKVGFKYKRTGIHYYVK
jgi:hypothetical protein